MIVNLRHRKQPKYQVEINFSFLPWVQQLSTHVPEVNVPFVIIKEVVNQGRGVNFVNQNKSGSKYQMCVMKIMFGFSWQLVAYGYWLVIVLCYFGQVRLFNLPFWPIKFICYFGLPRVTRLTRNTVNRSNFLKIKWL